MAESSSGRRGSICFVHCDHSPVLRSIRQEPKQELRRDATHWLALQAEVPSHRVTQVCVKFTETNQHSRTEGVQELASHGDRSHLPPISSALLLRL